MPIAGVARNPLGQVPGTRFHRNRLILMERRQDRITPTRAQPGTIRRWYRSLIGYTSARGSADFSWTRDGFDVAPAGAQGPVSSPLRYLITTRDTLTAGNQLSQPIARVAHKPSILAPRPPLVWVGNVQGRPTVRNRIVSFGSRIPALNPASADATLPPV